jgi:hypothetical protein
MNNPLLTHQNDPNLHSSRVTHAALDVVLQYWIIPNLGWTTKLYTSIFPDIRREIIDNKLHLQPNRTLEQKETLRKTLQMQYERTVAYFDAEHLQLLKDKLNSETPEVYLNNLQVSNIRH